MLEAKVFCSVIAAVRSPDSANELRDLKKDRNNQLSVVEMDITDEESIEVPVSEPSLLKHHMQIFSTKII